MAKKFVGYGLVFASKIIDGLTCKKAIALYKLVWSIFLLIGLCSLYVLLWLYENNRFPVQSGIQTEGVVETELVQEDAWENPEPQLVCLIPVEEIVQPTMIAGLLMPAPEPVKKSRKPRSDRGGKRKSKSVA